MIKLCAVLFISLLLPGLAAGHEYLVDDLSIVHPHVAPSNAGETETFGYVEFFNAADTDEALIAVLTAIADVSFFDPDLNDGYGGRRSDAIALPSGQSVLLEPGGLHIRFAGLDVPLNVGDTFDVTLIFAQKGPVTVEFWVEAPTGDAAAPQTTSVTVPGSNAPDDAAMVSASLRDLLGPETQLHSLVVEGPNAVVGWVSGTDAGRAFLRRTEQQWQAQVLSGRSLVSVPGLRAMGVSPRVADELLTKVTAADARLPQPLVKRMNGFAGTIHLVAP